jgi:phosphoglycolate phosphatase
MRVNRSIPAERLRLIIFDLDGTLVDSQVDLANSVNAMLRHYHRPELPAEVISTYIGDGAPMLVRRALGDPRDEHFVRDALAFFIHYYREHKLDNTRAYAGIPEALAVIRASRNGAGALQMAVLSNKPVNPSRAIVEALGIGEYFTAVYGGNSFETKKPDPLGARKLMEETGAVPEESVIVGDSSIDVVTGRNAGMWTVGVKYGLAPDTLEKAPPDVLVDTPEELAKVLGA